MKVYFGNTSKYSYPDGASEQELVKFLGTWRALSVTNNKTEPGRALSFCAGMTLKHAFCDQGRDLKREVPYFDKNGKPCIEGVEFSLSHSGEMALVAVSEDLNPVGCDVQKIENKPIERQFAIAKRFFTVRECGILQDSMQNSDTLFELLFYFVFSAKEAFIKMTGEGLSRAMNSFEIPLDEEMIEQIELKEAFCIERKTTIEDSQYKFTYFLPAYIETKTSDNGQGDLYVAVVCEKITS